MIDRRARADIDILADTNEKHLDIMAMLLERIKKSEDRISKLEHHVASLQERLDG